MATTTAAMAIPLFLHPKNYLRMPQGLIFSSTEGWKCGLFPLTLGIFSRCVAKYIPQKSGSIIKASPTMVFQFFQVWFGVLSTIAALCGSMQWVIAGASFHMRLGCISLWDWMKDFMTSEVASEVTSKHPIWKKFPRGHAPQTLLAAACLHIYCYIWPHYFCAVVMMLCVCIPYSGLFPWGANFFKVNPGVKFSNHTAALSTCLSCTNGFNLGWGDIAAQTIFNLISNCHYVILTQSHPKSAITLINTSQLV